jgi:hypothetical protein
MSQIFLVRAYPHKRKRKARRVPAEKLQTESSITFENPSLKTGFKQKEKSTIICIQIKSMILLMRAL